MRGFGLIVLPLGTGGGGGGPVVPDAPWTYPGILGLEYEIEYNGLLFNEHLHYGYVDNKATASERYKITEIGGLDDGDVRDSRELYTMRDGEYVLPAFYGGRTITLTGYVQAKNLRRLREMANALRGGLNDISIERELIFRAYPAAGEHSGDLMLMARKSAPLQLKDDMDPQTGKFRMSFMATFRASDPVFRSATATVTSLSLGSTTITNQGEWFDLPTITLIGPLTDPVVYNVANGDLITLTGTIAGGDTWTIDQKKRTITDSGGASKFGNVDLTATTWVRIMPGDNIVNLDGSGAGSAQISWRHAWL